MRRSRKEILDALMEQTQSDPILGSVASSLVGRELLNFGANVIYQVESLGNAVSNFADLARANIEQLIAYAYTHDVSCDTTKPAVVTITIHNLPDNTVYPPFSICLHVGACRFYNIDFIQSGQQIQLYQGTPCTSYTGSEVLDAFGLDTGLGNAMKTSSWKLYKEFLLGKYQSAYIKLGSKAISDSVRVFAKQIQTGEDDEAIVFPYTEFNQQLSSPEAKLYKVRAGWDKSINVLFGDDNWSMAIAQEQFNYQIYWLEATLLNFTISSRDELYLGYNSTTAIKSTFDKNSPEAPYYQVSSQTGAEADSLPYAKAFVQNKRFFQLGIVTEQQIINYLNILPSVNSSTVAVQTDGEIDVYIKPSDPTNTAFGFVEDYLYQYGVAGTTYKVAVATPVSFSVKLTPVGAQGQLLLARAQQIIDEYCDYANLKIDSIISSAILTQQLQRYGITAITADVNVENEPVEVSAGDNMALTATPEINSIKQYDKDGKLIGYDANGLYYSIANGNINGAAIKYISKLGDFLFVCSDDKSWILTYDQYPQGARFYGIETTNLLTNGEGPLIGKSIEYVQNDENVYVINGNKIYTLSGGWFKSGQGSILHNQVIIRPTETTSLAANVHMDSPVALWNNYAWYYTEGKVLQRENIISHTVSNEYGTTPNPFFVLDNTLYVLPAFETKGFSIGLLTLEGNLSEIDSMTAGSIPLGEATSEGDMLLDAIQNNGHLLSLSLETSNNTVYLHMGRLMPAGKAYNLTSDTPSLSFTGDITPAKILQASNGYIYLADTRGTTVWIVFPDQSQIKYQIANSDLAQMAGSVDYTNAMIYNIPNSDKSYLTYNVAGTIQGVSIYPLYVKG